MKEREMEASVSERSWLGTVAKKLSAESAELTALRSENARLRLQRDTLALYAKTEMHRTVEGRTDWALYDAAESVLYQIKGENTPVGGAKLNQSEQPLSSKQQVLNQCPDAHAWRSYFSLSGGWVVNESTRDSNREIGHGATEEQAWADAASLLASENNAKS